MGVAVVVGVAVGASVGLAKGPSPPPQAVSVPRKVIVNTTDKTSFLFILTPDESLWLAPSTQPS